MTVFPFTATFTRTSLFYFGWSADFRSGMFQSSFPTSGVRGRRSENVSKFSPVLQTVGDFV